MPTIPPRNQYLTHTLAPDESRPPTYDPNLVRSLPAAVLAHTGAIHLVNLPDQGVCNLLLLLEAEQGTFVLKVARRGYRSQELWAEHTVMEQLQATAVPVPRSLAFVEQGALSLQLREFSPGRPLKEVMVTAPTERSAAIREMGRTLAAIHGVSLTGGWTWSEWAEASLAQAERNLAAGLCTDPEEWSERAPREVLDWLHAHRPAGGEVCLLHGDYRPKNLLWHDGRIVSVIDWAFVDMGDPYYDLSIMRWYLGRQEWALFLDAYGMANWSQERFDWCMQLHKFLNV